MNQRSEQRRGKSSGDARRNHQRSEQRRGEAKAMAIRERQGESSGDARRNHQRSEIGVSGDQTGREAKHQIVDAAAVIVDVATIGVSSGDRGET
ncbi:hypothetical protein CMV_020131 [Castanea mollissima]|uniref:Uncharacterized protein n=1 Tax=Castanea mollissima TaxID=60419 RepID=A0A8J4QZ41_9ROSI|nr:hypothetical protein CMV_020131 [Castanea mollissima]